MTTIDGYRMTEKGLANEALGYHLSASVIGGLLGSLSLLFATPFLTDVALRFGPAEYFALGVFGMTCVTGLTGTSVVRGMITGAIGMLLATVGIDSISGMSRFTFGSGVLVSGIAFLPATIGLFAGAEIFKQIGRDRPFSVSDDSDPSSNVPKRKVRIKLPPLSEFYRSNRKWLVLKSAIIGILVGACPAVGATTAAVVSYGAAARSSKHPETFGTGEVEGVIAPEAGNNACAPAAFIPLLSLGIPGSANAAIILGAFLIHGLDAGPLFMVQQRELALHHYGWNLPLPIGHVRAPFCRGYSFHEASRLAWTDPCRFYSFLCPYRVLCFGNALCSASGSDHGDLWLFPGKRTSFLWLPSCLAWF